MSGANYEWCHVCDTKALYVGDADVGEDVLVLHEACFAKAVTDAAAAERERMRESMTAAFLADLGDKCRAEGAAAQREQDRQLAIDTHATCTVADSMNPSRLFADLLGGDRP